MLANEWDETKLKAWGVTGFPFEEEIIEEDNLYETDNIDQVIINLNMSHDQYSKAENEFQKFIKQYPKITCKIQN